MGREESVIKKLIKALSEDIILLSEGGKSQRPNFGRTHFLKNILVAIVQNVVIILLFEGHKKRKNSREKWGIL